MNPQIQKLTTYPFTRLRQLLSSITPAANKSPISMHIGAPQHAPPQAISTILAQADGLGSYPSSLASPELRRACADSLVRRYDLPSSLIDAENMIVPVSGTREGLFSFLQTVCANLDDTTVMMPNPFYQIYEGATLLAGCTPYYLDAPNNQGLVKQLMQVPADEWRKCRLLFICSPGNPDGHCLNLEQWQSILALSERHNFIIAADECYADIYRRTQQPVGLLEACVASGNLSLERCAVFHSLSKRSNLPGLRSGFVATSTALAQQFRQYREFHGCVMPQFIQQASVAAWQDDYTAAKNRQLYDAKFLQFQSITKDVWPQDIAQGGFYIWAKTPYDEQKFTQDLYAQQNVKVLPGRFLARTQNDLNPGRDHVRLSLVNSPDQCAEAARRIVEFLD